ncbi:hypothetical protein [Chitinophaga sp.]|uniref:hypothetical protein n=1 Tax=Chitinophaga sp. TaxID=1869181 RepID=UPI002F927AE6
MKYLITLLFGAIPFFAHAQYPSITETNSKIGIGTTTPTQKLEVAGNIQANGSLMSYRLDSVSQIGGLVSLINPIKTGAGEGQRWVILNAGGSSYGNSLQFWAYDFKGCSTGGMCANRFTIMDDGKVGINTAKPQTELAVRGTITAQKVKVTTTGWADFVFENDYVLPSLTELERQILKNKHLPGISAAAEIEKEGIDLGDMQQKHMQKIEELTLYVIQQDKEIKQLREMVELLMKERNATPPATEK